MINENELEGQLKLFDLHEEGVPVKRFKALKNPLWTENKAKLIERYLFYFLMITRHGTYIDGFAGPQKPEMPEAWAAKLALELQPQWLRHFYLFDIDPAQHERLQDLKSDAEHYLASNQEVIVKQCDFNEEVRPWLSNKPISEKEACFCLLDQRTFECHWSTLRAIAEYKENRKIELFYFLPVGWLGRSIKGTTKNTDKIDCFWGGTGWDCLIGLSHIEAAKLFSDRIRNDFRYRYVNPWPIYEKADSRRIMYYMIHATDHDEAPNLMQRAYNKAVEPKETQEQFTFVFEKWKESRGVQGTIEAEV